MVIQPEPRLDLPVGDADASVFFFYSRAGHWY